MTNNYNFFLGRMYFTINDGSQKMFVCLLIMFLVGNQMDYILLNLNDYILLSYIV